MLKQTGTEEISEVAVAAFSSHEFINIQILIGDVWEPKATQQSYIFVTPLNQKDVGVFNKLQARMVSPTIKTQTWLQWALEEQHRGSLHNNTGE